MTGATQNHPASNSISKQDHNSFLMPLCLCVCVCVYVCVCVCVCVCVGHFTMSKFKSRKMVGLLGDPESLIPYNHKTHLNVRMTINSNARNVLFEVANLI